MHWSWSINNPILPSTSKINFFLTRIVICGFFSSCLSLYNITGLIVMNFLYIILLWCGECAAWSSLLFFIFATVYKIAIWNELVRPSFCWCTCFLRSLLEFNHLWVECCFGEFADPMLPDTSNFLEVRTFQSKFLEFFHAMLLDLIILI